MNKKYEKKINKKYGIGLTIFVVLFIIISIISTMIGTGLFQTTFMLIAITLFAGIIIGGMYGLGPKVFWWEYFKPNAALPIAWGVLHLVLALVIPNVFHEIWTTHWIWLATIEISVFMLNTIVNRDTPFAKRASRSLLTTTFVLIFIASGVSIGLRIFAGEFTTNLNRAALYKVVSSKMQHNLVETEEKYKKNQAKDLMKELKKLSEKKVPTEDDLERINEIKTAIEKIYAVPEKQKINWEKMLSQVSSVIKPDEPVLKPSVTFLLPPGEVIEQDTSGNRNPYKKGDRAKIYLVRGKGSYYIIPTHGNPFKITNKKYQTGPAATDGITRLMASEGNDESLLIQVTIIESPTS